MQALVERCERVFSKYWTPDGPSAVKVSAILSRKVRRGEPAREPLVIKITGLARARQPHLRSRAALSRWERLENGGLLRRAAAARLPVLCCEAAASRKLRRSQEGADSLTTCSDSELRARIFRVFAELESGADAVRGAAEMANQRVTHLSPSRSRAPPAGAG